ncbi:MAG TPA: heparinase II/III family protein [Armatimonadota bacterium]|nr:heparinase II/III family protein [Armatimonadota bacterium]
MKHPILIILGGLMFLPVAALPGAPAISSHRDLYRLPLPEKLPPHPRLFCTSADLERIHRDAAAGDPYTRATIERIASEAEAALARPLPEGKPSPADFRAAAILGQGYALTANEAFGRRCRDMLLAFAAICPTLKTTRAAGRFTESTLLEGPVAVNAAMAYDLVAGAPFMSAPDRKRIEEDLLRILAWECGHRCHHRNSSNWRTWALAIIASCGFAIGDRALIEEAVNGIWDPERNAYLYGAVQTLTHSIFSDGIHWERSIGYTYYTASALMYVMVAAKNSGIDLWHAKLPGILGPFEGCAPHEEFGPPGDRSIRSFLDAPFFYAFPNGLIARVGDSGTRELAYHPIYELAYREYHDPRYAWLIRRHRKGYGRAAAAGWNVWTPSGHPTAALAEGEGRLGRNAFRLKCAAGDRAALVQDVRMPADRPARVTAWVRALAMDGGSAHIRCNFDSTFLFTERVKQPGDWRQLAVEIPARPGAKPGDQRSIRLHLFLEEGAGEVLWDDVTVTADGVPGNLAINPGFDETTVDDRALDFWSLVHAPSEVPEGRYSLDDDAAIGLNGRHVNGCTLFPVGGFAILRHRPATPESTAVNFTFGPYGSGHDHPDRLHFDLYGLGEILMPDAGSWGYNNPMHVTWANQSIAHNTLTVDEVAQEPQGTSLSVFAAERGDQRVFGVLRLFHPGNLLRAARATCDTAYPGVSMDRTLCLVGSYVLDVFRARSDAEHTYDLAFHGLGDVSTEAPLKPAETFTATGYAHLTRVRRGVPGGSSFRADFRAGERALLLMQAQPAGAEVILAKDPDRGTPTSCCIARRRGKNALYVTVLEPYTSAPTVRNLSVESGDSAVTVTVEHASGKDLFALENALDGRITLRRIDATGQARSEQTGPGSRTGSPPM